MSSLTNVVATEFRASGSNAIISATREMGAQTQSWYGKVRDVTNQSSVLNNQWRALGTTIRYAIAGQAVFGLTRMVGQLKDVQQQLGLIQAIGTQQLRPGGPSVSFSNSQVDKLGADLQKTAVNTITPINEINDATVNLLSTIQNVKPSDIPSIMEDIGRAAKVSQTPIQDLTQAATSMNLAFGRANNAKNIGEFARMWAAMISIVPGGIAAAPQLAQQLPAFSTLFRGGLSPNVPLKTAQAQEMSLVEGALRFGAPPATAMRGLQYLIQQIETPASKASIQALGSIGITPTTVRREGIYAAVMKFLHNIAPDTKGMSPASLKALSNMPDDQLETANAIPGVSPSRMAFMRTALGRIHAVRAAITLAAQLQANPGANITSLQENLDAMLGYQNNQIDDTHTLTNMWGNFQKRAKLQEASVAVNTLSLQVAQAVEPLINLAATGTTWGVKQAQAHRGVTRDLVLGGVGIAALLGGRRALGGLRGVGAAAGGAQALESLAGKMPTGQIENPFYVRVLGGPLSTGNPLVPPGGGNAARDAEKVAGGGIFSRFGRGALKYGGLTTIAAVATQQIADLLPKNVNVGGFKLAMGGGPFDSDFFNMRLPGQAQPGQSSFDKIVAIQHALGKQANMATGITAAHFSGKGKDAVLTLNINLKHPDGTTTNRKIHVPASLFSNGNIPSFQGQVSGRR
jgi:hypothetical protein